MLTSDTTTTTNYYLIINNPDLERARNRKIKLKFPYSKLAINKKTTSYSEVYLILSRG